MGDTSDPGVIAFITFASLTMLIGCCVSAYVFIFRAKREAGKIKEQEDMRDREGIKLCVHIDGHGWLPIDNQVPSVSIAPPEYVEEVYDIRAS